MIMNKEIFVGVLIVGFFVLVGFFAVKETASEGYAIKTLHKIEMEVPKEWVERRYICDLPNRDDCITCCDEMRRYTKGLAELVDYESCIVSMSKSKEKNAPLVWENCIRVASGLPLKIIEAPPVGEVFDVLPQINAPKRLLPLAPYKICSLLKKKPERSLIFMPYHPMMIASIIC